MVEDGVGELAHGLHDVEAGLRALGEQSAEAVLPEVGPAGLVGIDDAVGDAAEPVAGPKDVAGDLGDGATEARGHRRLAVRVRSTWPSRTRKGNGCPTLIHVRSPVGRSSRARTKVTNASPWPMWATASSMAWKVASRSSPRRRLWR